MSVNPIFTRIPVQVPKNSFPARGIDPDIAYQIVHDELMLEGPEVNPLHCSLLVGEETRTHTTLQESAQEALARAEAAERQAREAWDRAHDRLLEARRALASAKGSKSEA